MENKLKHLEFIQNTISRMANNLFYLRGWSITLIAGLLAVFSQIQIAKSALIILLIITFIFWVYDGYFLSLERKYRCLFDKIRKVEDDNKVDFSMDVKEFESDYRNNILFCIFSKTLFFFYFPLLIIGFYLIFKI